MAAPNHTLRRRRSQWPFLRAAALTTFLYPWTWGTTSSTTQEVRTWVSVPAFY